MSKSLAERSALDSQSLKRRALALAKTHAAGGRPPNSPSLLRRLDVQETFVRKAYKHFSDHVESPDFSQAAEWLLDNFYVVQRAFAEVRVQLPTSYYRQLPRLATSPLAGYPRVYSLAGEALRCCEGSLDIERVEGFVFVYQQDLVLTMGELWAFPTLMRLVVLEHLVRGVARLLDQPLSAVGLDERAWIDGSSDEDLVGHAVVSLHTLDTHNWKGFFEKLSEVEYLLRQDPSGCYGAMDFETRNRYRNVVEALSRASGRSEEAVAKKVVLLARERSSGASVPREEGPVGDAPRTEHVGYYLLDRGRELLEAQLGHRPGWKTRLRRWLLGHPSASYLGTISLLATALLWGVLVYAEGTRGWPTVVVGWLALIPAITVAVSLTNWIFTHLLPPRVLPKMDFQRGIPPTCRTLVVVPALISDPEEIRHLLRQLELHFLSNADPQLHFALLSGWRDAPRETMPEDAELLAQTLDGVRALNEKYERDVGHPFYLFHRKRRWNPSEGVWMGWERKRGKLVELNRYLQGDGATSYTTLLGDLEALSGVRYVITLDADTALPRETARRLVATLAHPLNHAEFDPLSGRVVAGYTVLQPRIKITPSNVTQTWFTRIFAGDTGLDLYSMAVSDVYQDLLGEGIYVGKGIYDVAAFERSLAGHVPENTLLSHDLFEGLCGRAALVSDVVLYEDYPPNYLAAIQRLHRWVRGDWQLLPWLFPGVFGRKRAGVPPVSLSLIDRWKMLDNLRRSLLMPALLGLLLLGWLTPQAGVWTLGVSVVPATALLLGTLNGLVRRALAGFTPVLRRQLARWVLALAFLPYEALLVLQAIAVTLGRLARRRHLLQWTTAARVARLFGRAKTPGAFWKRMAVGPLLAVGATAWVARVNPGALPAASPLLIAWFVSPQLAFLIGRVRVHRPTPLPEHQRRQLRCLARRTWLYFEHFVGPLDRWFPPDHFQEQPLGTVAHRTSPTNLGLYLLSALSAHDLGFIGPQELALRLDDSLGNMVELERYRGHFLNWYDTRQPSPLAPRYVSTVDSGNLAACLLTLRQGCLAMAHAPILCLQRWQGILVHLDLLQETVEPLQERGFETAPLRAQLHHLRQHVQQLEQTPGAWVPSLRAMLRDELPLLDQHIVTLAERTTPRLDSDTLERFQLYGERLHAHLHAIQQDVENLLPFLLTLDTPPALFTTAKALPDLGRAWRALKELSPVDVPLAQVPGVCERGGETLSQLRRVLENDPPSQAREHALSWCAQLARRLGVARRNAQALLLDYGHLAKRAGEFVKTMDFGFLFDPARHVFHIGFNVESNELDSNYYDLLASEARIASLVAIAKGDVSQRHWMHLGRPLTQFRSRRALLSWSGTMFEYLMPTLLVRHAPDTLLWQSCATTVERQIDYGKRKGVPWGISESGYYRFDPAKNYQYRAFGVPGLGLKRGLEQDLVVTPYASLLALPFDAPAVMKNLTQMLELGMLGHYGLYEALDFTATRLPPGQQHAVVSSYMAHHQGMILIALNNFFNDAAMVDRFHADPQVQSVGLLLQEHATRQAPVTHVLGSASQPPPRPHSQVDLHPWSVPVDGPLPQGHCLSNGHYSVFLTSAGGGYSTWKGLTLTRWRADTCLDDRGVWLYLKDLDSDELWSASYQPTAQNLSSHRVQFHPHKVELSHRSHDVALRQEVVVSPEHDVEIRRFTLNNESRRPRRLLLVSYAEVALAPQAEDARHPAFNKLFVESEFLPELNALLFHRRARKTGEDAVWLLHLLLAERGPRHNPVYETDRRHFLGREGSPRVPAALRGEHHALTGTTGATLDPLMALGETFELGPYGTARLAFVTLAASSRQQALTLADNYQSWTAVSWAFSHARTQHEEHFRRLGMDATALEQSQRLLSALVFAHPALRAEPSTLAANRRGQAGLWRLGISGDNPILLVHLDDDQDTVFVRELLKVHAHWRRMNVKADLVLLNRQQGGYEQTLHTQLHHVLNEVGGDEWLNRSGGVFVLLKEQLNETDPALLAAAARVQLRAGQGTLASQVRQLERRPQTLPQFMPIACPTTGAKPILTLQRPRDLLFDNGLGGFSADGREYVLFLEPGQTTPAPWVNVVANAQFGFVVSERGGGFSWAANSGEHRLSPWRNDPVCDRPGEALYLRDEETAEVWSPTPAPAPGGGPYMVRHGAGYTVFEHHGHGLRQRLKLFCPPDDALKVVELRLDNVWQQPRRITATFFVEWALGPDRQTVQYIVPEFDEDAQALLARNPYFEEFGSRVAFVASDRPLHGLSVDRVEFLGRMGDYAHPAALERVGLSDKVEAGLDPCAALQVHLDLAPGTSETVYFLLGEGNDLDDARRLLKHYRNPAQAAVAWQALGAFWDDVLGTFEVKTPEPAMDLMLNRWLLYQTLSCRVWGRSALYQSSGAFGFRDQLQDVLALLYARPDVVRGHLLAAATHQFEQGDVLHWWHPPSGRGVRTRCSDDLLWLPYVTAHYVALSGDEGVLDEQLGFLQGDPLGPDEHDRYAHYERGQEGASLYEHCCRSLDRGATTGTHGLPLMGDGDWNDGMNAVGAKGQGESVWLGWFLCDVLTRFAPLCQRRGEPERAQGYTQRAADLRVALQAHAWDGQWYVRAFYDDGTPLGSARNAECQIDAIAQSWAVLSGAGNPRRAEQAMEAVAQRLVAEEAQLIRLFTPPFDQTASDPGYIKGYPPGIRENGGQYTHAALWTVWAFAKLGQGERAEALFALLNPIAHGDTPEKIAQYRVEPYVVAADVYDAPAQRGRGGWSWYTGSASWMYRLGLEGLLGVQKTGQTLRIDPCIPASWPGYELTYRRGKTCFHIQVRNPKGVCRGVREVSLDAQVLADRTISLQEDGRHHEVVVTLG